MGALESGDLYLQHVSVKDDLPDDSYVAHLPVVESLREMGGLAFRSPATMLVGGNGVGKSTLVEAIAVALKFNPEGGTVNFNFL